MMRSTFFDEGEEPELGEKQKTRSRRSSFRKTLTLLTESRRSLDFGTSPLSPTSPRHRRSFSFHRRASSSATSVTEYPQSPSQYYNDPEARMKLKMVVSSPESFDQALEHGFPSTTKLDAIGGEPETLTQRLARGRANTTGSPPKVVTPYQAKSRTFFDTSSVSSEGEDGSDEEDEEDSNTFRRSHHGPEPKRQFEYQSYPTDHNLESDDESVSDNDSPATPHWADATSRIASPTRPELYLDRDTPSPYIGGQLSDNQTWENGNWVEGPREMTLRMTLTKPELRSPAEQLYGWQGTGAQDPLGLPYIKDSGNSKWKGQQKQKISRSPPNTVETTTTPPPPPAPPKSSPSAAKPSRFEVNKPKTGSKKPSPESKPTTPPRPPPSTGKVRGLWRKVKDRKG